uniref:Uncharacterized protein n=1 Tax=Ditylenchus dipsaci TaxID=166011 RepID=A0A915E1J7_9BILA
MSDKIEQNDSDSESNSESQEESQESKSSRKRKAYSIEKKLEAVDYANKTAVKQERAPLLLCIPQLPHQTPTKNYEQQTGNHL